MRYDGSPAEALHWYLVRLKPGGFARACLNLERQGFATFMPLARRTRTRTGRLIVERAPLYPGYLFVRCSPDGPPMSKLRSTFGVAGLVSAGQSTAPVSPFVIGGLMARTGHDGTLLSLDTFEAGEQVRVLAGPFADEIAKVERLAPEGRIGALIEMMGRTVRMDFDPGDLLRA